MPGLGGRAPVRWLGRPPTRQKLDRRPVIAILDTGVAVDHPWFADDEFGPVVTRLRYDPDTQSVVPGDSRDDGGESQPNLIDPLEGLVDPFFGHGTFIAGLIRQVCPDAHILSIKVMGTDGIVGEADLVNALGYLHGLQSGDPEAEDGLPDHIDVVSLSLGYYHEATAAGTAYDNVLRSAIDALGAAGILVVASAGNNASSLRLLPAGFTSFAGGKLPTKRGGVPLISVGALNPDGSVALFSNAGDWVCCHSPGAALVSTLPIADTGLRSGVDLGFNPPDERSVASWRATIDPDSFTGFGTWSGTSFAAPVAAAAIAQELVRTPQSQIAGSTAAGRLQQALTDLDFPVVVG
jgi:subtilisin family serine protease